MVRRGEAACGLVHGALFLMLMLWNKPPEKAGHKYPGQSEVHALPLAQCVVTYFFDNAICAKDGKYKTKARWTFSSVSFRGRIYPRICLA